jgi:RHH-type rel operon transcriptional repressor/antitoxin RelB
MSTTAKREQVSFKLESDTKRRLEALATATRRTRTVVIEEAVTQYLDMNEWQLKCIEEGLEDARAGRYIDSDTLIKKLERRIADGVD